MKEGGGQAGQWGLPRVFSFWVTGLGEFPNAQGAAYLVTNYCWLPTQDAWLSGYLPVTFLSMATATLPSPLSALGCRKETDRQAGG